MKLKNTTGLKPELVEILEGISNFTPVSLYHIEIHNLETIDQVPDSKSFVTIISFSYLYEFDMIYELCEGMGYVLRNQAEEKLSEGIIDCTLYNEIRLRGTKKDLSESLGSDAIVVKLKENFLKFDLVMSELLRCYRTDLSKEQMEELIAWSGDDDFIEVTEKKEIVRKDNVLALQKTLESLEAKDITLRSSHAVNNVCSAAHDLLSYIDRLCGSEDDFTSSTFEGFLSALEDMTVSQYAEKYFEGNEMEIDENTVLYDSAFENFLRGLYARVDATLSDEEGNLIALRIESIKGVSIYEVPVYMYDDQTILNFDSVSKLEFMEV